MQVVELYISNTRVDLFKDESVTITDTIVNAKDVAKVFTAFSQQFSLPASSTNNQIFKHYYNWNITLGSFDARVRVSAILKLNGVDFKIGKVKLNSVSMKDNKAYSYKVVFYGETVALNDILGEDKLSNLTNLNPVTPLIYNADNIEDYLQLDPATNDIIAPLITHTKQLYYKTNEDEEGTGNLWYSPGTGNPKDHGVLWSELKYAIRIDTIVQAIEANYGITFSNDFFVNTNAPYYNLFMWLHRKSGDVGNGDQVSTFPTSINGWTAPGGGSGDWATMSNISTLTVKPDFQNFTNAQTLLQLQLSTGSSDEYAVEVLRNGLSIYQASGLTGQTTLSSGYNTTNDFGNTTLAAGEWSVIVTVTTGIVFTNIGWTVRNDDGSGSGAPNTFDTSDNGTFTCDTTFEFVISQQTPDIKIIDFLTGLFKMFNLVAYTKEDGSIYVNTLDAFYATSTTYDITKYIDVNTSSVDVSLPYRQINFTYKGLGTFLAAQWEQLNVAKWGAESFNGDGNLDGGIYSVVAPFEHMLFERLVDLNDVTGGTLTTAMYGYCTNDNQQPYIGSPILFYPILKTGGATTTISFLQTPNTHIALTSYVLPSNSVALAAATSTANINFGNMINEYTGLNNYTGTLYQNYYSSYIENLFLESSRLVNYTAYLPLHIILNYTLADIFVINGQQFRINSLNINLTNNKSQIELITI